MNKALQKSHDTKKVWEAYRNNFSRHLLGVTRYLQTEMMGALQQDRGHQDLRLGFAPYITLIGQRGQRPSTLAEVLGISKQACNQAANQIEAAGYITRTADPADGRATLLLLTDNGRKLRDDGLQAVSVVDKKFGQLVGTAAITDARKTLQRIHAHLGLGLIEEKELSQAAESLGALLPRLGDYILQRLMQLTREKGHPGLQLSFGQVLTLIGKSGGRIQQIAKIQDVSKQAISATATELENLGYLRRDTDPTDSRQIVLQFTDQGRELMIDSIASVNELEAEFSAITSNGAMARLKDTFHSLYKALHLEQGIFGDDAIDIEKFAQQIQQQLGPEESQALAQLLLKSGHMAG